MHNFFCIKYLHDSKEYYSLISKTYSMSESEEYLNWLVYMRDNEIKKWVEMICYFNFDGADKYSEHILITEREIESVRERYRL